ncbi:uncharacterized protein EV422DRAFT_508707 [Fimicolochytrium jonesii]|uniref:uncharacterized protein n=1 Tax=Fimicolochytrium jonesii TaxID=1396493 RepID=UPI0022FDD4ED|nr:uncharacterized protein EV422DRAFT_508707 [Fimicolochytrium jonesii]KAI8817885.1 hypothetical protein EV422DRAFT_508707 [Fimicolochytrium jonesii]
MVSQSITAANAHGVNLLCKPIGGNLSEHPYWGVVAVQKPRNTPTAEPPFVTLRVHDKTGQSLSFLSVTIRAFNELKHVTAAHAALIPAISNDTELHCSVQSNNIWFSPLSGIHYDDATDNDDDLDNDDAT